MARKFSRLTRSGIRALKPGEKLTEHGITTESQKNGDVRYSVNFMVDGERIHRVIGRESDGTTRTQAEEFIEAKRTAAREGRLSLPKGRKLHLTFGTAADLYLEKLKEIGGKDYVNNEQHIRLHLRPYFGNMRLDKITEFTVQKFQNHSRGKRLSDSTVNRVLATYRRMSRRLVGWKVIPALLPMVKLTREDNIREFVISDDEESQMLKAADQDSNTYIGLFIRLGIATGLRHSEILAARFDNFDPVRRRLRVRTKGGRWRNQPLTRGITKLLQHEREMAQDRTGWIFPSKRSNSGHAKSMHQAFARCVVKAELNPEIVVPHIMRHTAITRYAATGADLKSIQEFGGHLSIQMVLRYVHASDRAIDNALDRMEGGTVIEHPGIRNRADS